MSDSTGTSELSDSVSGADPTQGELEYRAAQQVYKDKFIAEAGFDNTQDTAALVVRYFNAISNRYHADNEDPVLAPILATAAQRYGQLRVGDFTLARQVTDTEAVRHIMGMQPRPGIESQPDTAGVANVAQVYQELEQRAETIRRQAGQRRERLEAAARPPEGTFRL